MPLTAVRAFKLAEVISKCRGHGTSKLRLVTPDGTEIDYGPEVVVNHHQFKTRANDGGVG
jgi:hypothetical protein